MPAPSPVPPPRPPFPSPSPTSGPAAVGGAEPSANPAGTVSTGGGVNTGGGVSTGGGAGLGYQPALDGLRGLALAAIILYHSELDLAPGAFLSVSTFFTLSGFLITSVLLTEHQRDGRISLRTFWVRRLRRLLPASLVAIAAITATTLVWGDSTQLSRLRADALAALAYVANWRFVAAGDAYGAAFDSPSPFTHFWTLAIEEQLYVVIPLLVVAALHLGRRSPDPLRRAGLIVGAVIAAAILWSNLMASGGASIDRLYFGTDIRLAEILAGSALAIWWQRHRGSERPAPRWIAILGPLAAAAMVISWSTAELRQLWFYRGGLVAYTALTGLTILAAIQPNGPVRRALAWPPLVWVGTVSYGAYLLHYPVLLWLRQAAALSPALALAAGAPLTFGLAALSARHLEGPIRSGRRIATARVPAAALGSIAVTLAIVLVSTATIEPADRADFEAALRWQRYLEATEAQERSDAPRLSVYGDSTALMTSQGLVERSRDRPDDFVAWGGWANLGCGLVDRGSRITKGQELAVPSDCLRWEQRWATAAAEKPADVAVIQLGPWEVVDQRVDPDGPLLTIGEPELDALLAERLRLAIDTLLRDNVVVAILEPPDIDAGRVDGRSPTRAHPESEPARMARFRTLVDEVIADYPDVEVVDLAGWLDGRDDRALRPDGVHFTDSTTLEVADWLGPELTELYRRRTGKRTSTVKGR